MLPKQNHAAWLSLCLAAISPSPSSSAQTPSLCDDFHVPAAHIGNVQGCLFDGNNTTTITFNAPAILLWERGFRIDAGQNLRFAFPGIGAGAVLNRDLSGGNSNIAGTITSDGRVLLINPGGDIAIQGGALIDTDGGFLASTLDTADDEALLAGRDAEFQGNAFSAIDNRGTVSSSGGDIVLISGSINNFASGQLLATSGSVHLGAGTRIRLAAAGEPRITVLEGEPFHSISNQGTISANSTIDLSAFTPGPVPDGQRNPSVSNHGVIRTTSPGGRVFLRALPGNGQVLNSAGGEINTMLIAIDGALINEGAIIGPDDGANPGAPTGTRQIPRLTTGALTQTANSDFRLSRLSFSHLNGLESKTTKSPKPTKKKAALLASNTRGTSDQAKKKTQPTATGKKIVLRRGTFFGKKTE